MHIYEGSGLFLVRGVEFSGKLVRVNARDVGAEGSEGAPHSEGPAPDAGPFLGNAFHNEFDPVAINVIAHRENNAHTLGDLGDVFMGDLVAGEVEGFKLAVDSVVDAVDANELEERGDRVCFGIEKEEGLCLLNLRPCPFQDVVGEGLVEVVVEFGLG